MSAAAAASAPVSPEAIYLGFDYGLRRIGVAVGNAATRSARPLPALVNGRAPDWAAAAALIERWRPVACVVGLPLDLDGGEQPLSRQAREFARQLGHRCGLPVHLTDERLSSRAADGELRQARADGRMTRRVRKGDRDGVAARLILEQWLAAVGDRAPPADPPTPR